MKGRDRLRRTLFKRIRQAEEAALPALTMVRARAFLAVFPNYGPAWFALGGALEDLGRYEEAERALLKSIEYCPPEKMRIPYGAMGRHFQAIGDHDLAEEWFCRAIAEDPDHAAGHVDLGSLYAIQGRQVDAEVVYRQGTYCSRGFVDEAYLNLALVLRAQERFDEAAQCLEEALRIDPEYRAAKRVRRDVLACLRRRDQAGSAGADDPPP
ncbi:MAG: tetratricopeptide repeat protein [Isosphaeraceae bacterium]